MSVRSPRRVRRTHGHTDTQTDNVKTITPITSETWGVKSSLIDSIRLKLIRIGSTSHLILINGQNSILFSIDAQKGRYLKDRR